MDVLDAAVVRRWGTAALSALQAHRADLDALNVFPVPDGDTGTNLVATVQAANDALATGLAIGRDDPETEAGAPDAHAAFVALSRGAARGAVGNSGFIVSQLLRGFAEAPSGVRGWDATSLCAGLDLGARLGRDAVVSPVEGTILTVARAAADAAARELSEGDATLVGVGVAATRAAEAAVAATPTQLAHLAAAGVVDAGGHGLLLMLDALARTLDADLPPLTAVLVPAGRISGHPEPPDRDAPGREVRQEMRWEVQYLLSAPADAVPALRAALTAAGESVAVVPTDGPAAWKVHVHTSDVGAAVDAGLAAGRPHAVEIVALDGNARAAGRASRVEPSDRRGASFVVAVAPDDELAHLFSGEGVHVVGTSAARDPASTSAPEQRSPDDETSVDAVLAAISAGEAEQVIVLPNSSRDTGIAERAAARARATGLRVTVVPTRSPVQGLAAVAVHDPRRRFDDDVVAMAEAAAATRFAEVSSATERALTAVGMCEPGDVLGLIDGEVVEIGHDVLTVALGLLDRLLGIGAELVTVLVGREAPSRAAEVLEKHARERAPLTDVAVHHGGHPEHPVIIGAE